MSNSGNVTAYVQGWTGFAPGLVTRDAWTSWLLGKTDYNAEAKGKPPLAGVPPAYKRRCSLLTKMVLDTCLTLAQEHQIDPQTVWSVFASRHGEIGVLEGLFSDLHKEEPMSPIDFCNSVHHTPTGYFGIIAKNRSLTRTISAAENTFPCALLDTLGLLTQNQSRSVLLAAADIPVPAGFGHPKGDVIFPHAVTFLLTRDQQPDGLNHPVTIKDALDMMGSTSEPKDSILFRFTRELVK